MVVDHIHENQNLVVGHVHHLQGKVLMVVAEDGDSNPADSLVDAVAGTYDDVAVSHALDSAAVGMNDALARGIEVVSVVSDFVILVD